MKRAFEYIEIACIKSAIYRIADFDETASWTGALHMKSFLTPLYAIQFHYISGF